MSAPIDSMKAHSVMDRIQSKPSELLELWDEDGEGDLGCSIADLKSRVQVGLLDLIANKEDPKYRDLLHVHLVLEQGRHFDPEDEVCARVLILAVCFPGTTKVVQRLLENRANPNSKDDYGNGFSVLWWALMRTDPSTRIVEMLIKYGATFNSTDVPVSRHLTYKDEDENSDKYWRVEVYRNTLKVTYGKTGTAGTTKSKTFNTEEGAIKEAAKLMREKLKKGYRALS